jgi:hypothetical protein
MLLSQHNGGVLYSTPIPPHTSRVSLLDEGPSGGGGGAVMAHAAAPAMLPPREASAGVTDPKGNKSNIKNKKIFFLNKNNNYNSA